MTDKPKKTSKPRTRRVDDSNRLNPKTIQSPRTQRMLQSLSPKERVQFFRENFPHMFDTLYIEE